MNLEEKIAHLQTSAMQRARKEGNDIISAYREALEKDFENHKEEVARLSNTRIKSEAINAKHKLNKQIANSQLLLKREEEKVQRELKAKLFEDVENMVNDFMKTKEYYDTLVKYIENAKDFAKGEELIVYINETDKDQKQYIEEKTNVKINISDRDFIGGVRCVLKEKEILIDNSYKTKLEQEYNNFVFEAGEKRE